MRIELPGPRRTALMREIVQRAYAELGRGVVLNWGHRHDSNLSTVGPVPDELVDAIDVPLVECRYVMLPRDCRVERHAHPWDGWVFMLSDHPSALWIDGDRYPTTAGELLELPRDVDHEVERNFVDAPRLTLVAKAA